MGGKKKRRRGRGVGAALVTAGLAGAGVLAYKNRDRVIEGVDKAGERATRFTQSALNKGGELYAKGASKINSGVEKGAASASRNVRRVAGAAERNVERAKASFRSAVERVTRPKSSKTEG